MLLRTQAGGIVAPKRPNPFASTTVPGPPAKESLAQGEVPPNAGPVCVHRATSDALNGGDGVEYTAVFMRPRRRDPGCHQPQRR